MVSRSEVVLLQTKVSQGTGFLVTPELLVTALHVVAEFDSLGRAVVDDKGLARSLGPVTCTYYCEMLGAWSEVIEFDPQIDAHNPLEDWAVLRVQQTEGARIWATKKARASDHDAKCWAYGFPSTHEDKGTPYSGRLTGIRDPSDAATTCETAEILIHRVWFREASGWGGQTPKGFSGGPVVVADRAVGIVRRFHDAGGDVARGATVDVTPIEVIYPATGLEAVPQWTQPPAEAEPKVAPTRLGHGAPTLFGRDDELAQLESAWADPQTKLMTIVAWGGVGKTALVHEFRNRLVRRDEPAWVFDWSFYSQGTRDVGAVSADSFIREALLFFGDPELADDSKASAWRKGERLAELVASRRALVILDGLEPLQEPPAGKGQAGAVREQSVRALLLGLANRNRGLCLVTTRVPVLELQDCERTTAPRVELDRLSKPAGVMFLRSLLGKASSTEADLGEICEEVDGHALSLQLLGSYIRRALGDARRWREIDLRRANEDQGGHAFRVIAAYERWLGQAGAEGERELAVLRMMGLFDRPADPGCITALRREPAIAGLTDALVGLDRQAWRALLASLEEARLLGGSAYVPTPVRGYDEATARAAGQLEQPQGEAKPWPVPEHGPDALVLDAHPLVREYFGDALRRSDEAAWREGHRRLYEHLRESVPHWPEGIEGLQPLFQALVHGCAAGRVQESLVAVYQGRILRGARFYSVHQLGAFGASLAAVANFFEQAWDRPSPELSAAYRAWVLSEAAFCLRGVGRLSESLEPTRAGLEMLGELEDWTNAARVAGNLSELELTLGLVCAAVDDATLAVAHADRSEDAFQRMVRRTTLADARLAAGEWAQARALFEQTEAMQAHHQPNEPQLYSVRGHQYCELLLGEAERAAWRESATLAEPSELLPRCAEVFERATRARKAAVRLHRTLDIALDHLTCGRAALYAARLHARAPTLACTLTLEHAREQLEAAVDTLREAGTQDFLPKGLLTRAWLHQLGNRDDLAERDLDEAWTLAIRGPMLLHQADIQLHRARLFHDRDALTQAATLIDKLGYHRRLGELHDAQAQLMVPS